MTKTRLKNLTLTPVKRKVGRPRGTTKANGYKVSTGRPPNKKPIYQLPKNWGKWLQYIFAVSKVNYCRAES